MKSLKVLYIDTPFLGFNSGSKNRSNFLYKSINEEFITDLLLIKDEEYSCKVIDRHLTKNNNVFTIDSEKSSIFKPNSTFDFNINNLDKFKNIIKISQYDICFFKCASMSKLAELVQNINLNIKVIIDIDMLFSQISKVAWEQKKTFKNRYFFQENIKFYFFEKSLFLRNYTYLYANKSEMELVKSKYKIIKSYEHYLLPNVINKMKEINKNKINEKYLLFYGVLNSTANLTAYDFLITKVYPLLKDFLEKENIKIYIVGKNPTDLHLKPLKHIKLIGEVDDLVNYIKNALLVIFPLTVAAGTLTRILEVAYLKKAIVTTPKAVNGLDLEGKVLISKDEKDFVKNIVESYNNPEVKKKFEKLAYNFVHKKHNSSIVGEQLSSIVKSPRRINVLHIPRRFAQSHWGGGENAIVAIANSLEKFGVNSKLVTTNIFSKKNNETLHGIEVKRFNYFYPYFNLGIKNKNKLDLVGGNLFSWSLLTHLLFVKDIDLIHLHTGKRLGSIARTVCSIRNIPYVITVHGGVYNMNKDEVEERMSPTKGAYEWGKILGFIFGSRKVYKDAKAIITLNSIEYEKTKSVHNTDKVHLLPNSIDISQFRIEKSDSFRNKHNISSNDFLFFCSGRIDPQKNQLLILNSFKELLKTNENIHLLLVGNVTNESYLENIKTYINDNGMSNSVTVITNLKPHSKELINCYVNSNAFILASRHEPFGIVALEAMASNLPLIVSDICGVCNVLKDNEDSLFFKDDDLNSLLEKMRSLLNDKNIIERLVTKASKEILKYDQTIVNQKILDIYKKAISE